MPQALPRGLPRTAVLLTDGRFRIVRISLHSLFSVVKKSTTTEPSERSIFKEIPIVQVFYGSAQGLNQLGTGFAGLHGSLHSAVALFKGRAVLTSKK